MKQRKVFLSAILAAIIVMIFANCSGSNTEDPEYQNNTGLFELKTTGLKSLYVSDMRVQSEAHAAIDNSTLRTLTYINAAGQNSPVYFISSSGKIIVLEVYEIERIDDQRIVVNFNSFYEVSEEKTEENGQSVTTYVVGERQGNQPLV